MSKVHIVVATYNGEKYLRQQLDSILAGTEKDISIEICEDGSTDETVSIAKEYVSKYPDMISLHQNHINLGYRLNFLNGIKRSESSYIMLCDQDDIWLPDKVEITLKKMKEIEDVNVPCLVFADANLYNGDTDESMGRFHEKSHLDTTKIDVAHLLMENKCIGCTIMINKKVLSYLDQLPDSIRVHDWWLALICASFGKIHYLNRVTLLYRQHDGNIIGGTSFSAYISNRISSLKQQKMAIWQCYLQGKDFYEIFQNQLTMENKECVFRFSQMSQKNWLWRRWNCFRFGYWKTGLVRNIGLLILL